MTNNCDNFSNPIDTTTGGTNNSSFTAYSILCAGTTSTAPLQNVSGLGSSTQALTSNGPSALPTWQTGPGGVSILSLATVTLTSAQVKALHGTPIQIIAAPGSGKIVLPVTVSAEMKYGGSNVFVAGASQWIELRYNSAAGQAIGTILSNTSIVASQSRLEAQQATSFVLSNNATAAVENLKIVAYEPFATEISGNAANNNTVIINVWYEILTL
jgi:hypothetical protein